MELVHIRYHRLVSRLYWLKGGQRKVAAIILGLFLIMAASCNSSPDNSTPYSAFFPVQIDEYAKDPYPTASTTGMLVLDNNYLRLKPLADIGDSSLLIWPPGFSARAEGNVVHIIDKDGKKVASIGDKIEVNGGQVPVETVEKYIGYSLPTDCKGPYWIVSTLVKN